MLSNNLIIKVGETWCKLFKQVMFFYVRFLTSHSLLHTVLQSGPTCGLVSVFIFLGPVNMRPSGLHLTQVLLAWPLESHTTLISPTFPITIFLSVFSLSLHFLSLIVELPYLYLIIYTLSFPSVTLSWYFLRDFIYPCVSYQDLEMLNSGVGKELNSCL